MRPLHVLFVLPSLERGGAERVVANLANGLAAIGASPGIILTGSTGPLEHDLDPDVPVAALNRKRVRAAMIDLIRRIRGDTPDVLFSTHTHLNLALCFVRPLLPRSLRLVIREPIHAPIRLEGRSTTRTRWAQRLLYRHADLVLASSDVVENDLRTLTGANIARLDNPVDRSRLRGAAVSTVPSPRSGRVLISVGRLTPQKAIDELLRAFATARDPQDRLEILGEGPERQRLEALVRELGLRSQVTLHGTRSDHWGLVAGADALILASHEEGMPNAVLEALALGTPVLATTDLEVLFALSTEVPDGALTLVERQDLANAIARIARIPDTALPRRSLLPERFERATVIDRLMHLLWDLSPQERRPGRK